MGIFRNWFGKQSIPEELNEEIKILDKLLEDTISAEKSPKRIKSIIEALEAKSEKNTNEIKYDLSILSKIEETLDKIISGEIEVDDPYQVVFLAQMHRELKEDDLWKELVYLFSKEVKSPLSEVAEIRKKEEKIIKYIKIISEAELNETHSHFNMSVDIDSHWKYLVKNWDKLKQVYLEAKDEGKIYSEDYYELVEIMNEYFKTKNNYKCMLNFEKLLFMKKEDIGTFNNFVKKCNILDGILSLFSEFDEKRKEYFLDQLSSMARHNLNHNVTQIEIRFPAKTKEEFEFLSDIAKETENKFPIKIRYVVFCPGFSSDDVKESIESYKKSTQEVRKYFVGYDSMNYLEPHKPHLKREDEIETEIIKESPLPVVVHVGEIFNVTDDSFGYGSDKYFNVEKSLNEVEGALKIKNIYRLGHATILGINIKEFLKDTNHTEEEIDELVAKQKKLLNEVSDRGIIIEANPTSNLMIHGLKTYEDHPIKTFSEYGIHFSINTDDRIIFDTNLRKEFYKIARARNWSEEELKKAIKMTQEAKL